MSVKYTEIVMPAPDAMHYRPSPADVLRLVDHLQQTSWIRSPGEGSEQRLYVDPAAARDRLNQLDSNASYSLWFAGGPSDLNHGVSEWPENDGCFVPEYCEDVKVVCGTRLATPRGDGFEMECPNCGTDLHSQMSAALEAQWQQEDVPGDLNFIDSEFLYAAPERCARCAAPIVLTEVVTSQGEFVEEAPFALFMINFLALRTPPIGVAYMDPEFMASLGALLGVGFRSIGRWS
jgi:hypothetical protein